MATPSPQNSPKKKKSKTKNGTTQENTSGEREALIEKLHSRIEEIDEEGLRFLLRQADTLIHNQTIDEFNRNRAETEPPGRSDESSRTGKSKVFFEQKEGSKTFILDVEGKRTILDQEELMAMVRIAQNADTEKSRRAKVYRWIETHRDDILFDCGIDSQGPRIEALCSRLNNDFAIRS